MSIHDWTRVGAGIYHDFHNAWIIHFKEALNFGILPKGYSALSDQKVSLTEPDIITIGNETESEADTGGGVAVAAAVTPRIQMKAEAEPARRLRRRRRVVIRRDSDDRVVAIVEVTSPGNKDSRLKARSLAEKVAAYLEAGVHVLLVDILPPTNCDPLGIHGLIWEYCGRKRHTPSAEEPLTLVSYRVTENGPEAQIEPTAVGRLLPSMPLYLKSDLAVPAPLETTYMQAFRGMGERYRRAVENAPAGTGQA
jgi:hypothetical protein